MKIRLYGIDCPEKKQAFGTKAKRFDWAFVSEIVVSKELSKKVVLKATSGVARIRESVWKTRPENLGKKPKPNLGIKPENAPVC